jgi:hypothetical protein
MRDLETAMRDLRSRGRELKMPPETEFVALSESRSRGSLTDTIDMLVEGLGIPTRDEPGQKREDSSYTCGRSFSIHKASKDEMLGIELGKVHKYGGVFVTKIEPTSKFASTGLTPGMQILSINDRPCPVVFQMVAMMMKETVGDLKLSAIDSADKNHLAMAIQKEKEQQKKGVYFSRSLVLPSINTKKSKNPKVDYKESRDNESYSPTLVSVRSPPPTATKPFSGSRLMAHLLLHKRYHKMRAPNEENRNTKESSSHREGANDSSTDTLLQISPPLIAFYKINLVSENLSKFCSALNTMPSLVAEEYYESKGMGVF